MTDGTPTLELPHVLAGQLRHLAQKARPLEVVGLLSGPREGVVSAIYPLENIAQEPERNYLAEPAGLLRAITAMRADRLELVGIYHSHPNGPTTPSGTDIERAEWDVPYLIVDAERGLMQAWLLLGGVRQVRLELI